MLSVRNVYNVRESPNNSLVNSSGAGGGKMNSYWSQICESRLPLVDRARDRQEAKSATRKILVLQAL
jgi:hypothetical protein